MKRRMTTDMFRLGIFMVASAVASAVLAANVNVELRDFENDKGVVHCGLYQGADGWRDEARALKAVSSPIREGKAVCRFTDVAPGQYAVAAFHAQNGETKVSYGLFGKPKQGVGFSNNPSITFGPPNFDDAAFTVRSQDVAIPVQMRY